MISGGKKFEKTQKSKFKKNKDEYETFKQMKKRQKDKVSYRLMREEEKVYWQSEKTNNSFGIHVNSKSG